MNPAVNSEEEAFHARLDEHPDDFGCRLVYADWLDDRGDPRAAGYRALAAIRSWPHGPEAGWAFHCSSPAGNGFSLTGVMYPGNGGVATWNDECLAPQHYLPEQWCNLIDGSGPPDPRPHGCPRWFMRPNVFSAGPANVPRTRRTEEDAAALAWPLVPEALKAEILSGRHPKRPMPVRNLKRVKSEGAFTCVMDDGRTLDLVLSNRADEPTEARASHVETWIYVSFDTSPGDCLRVFRTKRYRGDRANFDRVDPKTGLPLLPESVVRLRRRLKRAAALNDEWVSPTPPRSFTMSGHAT